MKEGEGMILETKVCKKCGIVKPNSEFYDNDICMECKEKEISNG